MLNWPRPLPLEDERVRLMHEVQFLEVQYEKSAFLVSDFFSSHSKDLSLLAEFLTPLPHVLGWSRAGKKF